MRCPVCDANMREVEKNGVLIDICPDCKGVWLDRGELDKLMAGVREVRQDFNHWYEQHDQDYRHQSYPHGYPKKKKKHVLDMLGDLFDF
jgi:hypothetical protein